MMWIVDVRDCCILDAEHILELHVIQSPVHSKVAGPLKSLVGDLQVLRDAF